MISVRARRARIRTDSLEHEPAPDAVALLRVGRHPHQPSLYFGHDLAGDDHDVAGAQPAAPRPRSPRSGRRRAGTPAAPSTGQDLEPRRRRGQSTGTPASENAARTMSAVASTSDISSGTARTVDVRHRAPGRRCAPASRPAAPRRTRGASRSAGPPPRRVVATPIAARHASAMPRTGRSFDDRRDARRSARRPSPARSRRPGTASTVPTLTTGFDGASSTTSARGDRVQHARRRRRLVGADRHDRVRRQRRLVADPPLLEVDRVPLARRPGRRPRRGSPPGRRTSAAASRPAASARTAPRSPRRAGSRRAASGCAPGGWRCPCRPGRTTPSPAPYAASSSLTVQLSPVRPQPRSASMPPPRVYMQVSRSGQIRRPCSHTSSPVFTSAVTSCATGTGQPSACLTPCRNRAPPTPPTTTTTFTPAILARAGSRPSAPEEEREVAHRGAGLVAADRAEHGVRDVEEHVGRRRARR